MQSKIRTIIKHEETSSRPDKKRGSRYWAAAEIMSATWFFIETCIEEAEGNEIKRWVTTSIREAVEIQRCHQPYEWSRIFVCLRAPLSVRNAVVFEVVTEVHHLGSSGAYLYRLENGMSFSTDEGTADGVQPNPAQLVYAQRR